LNVHQVRQIDCPPAESDDDSAPESISDTKNWLNWNHYLEDPNESKDNCEADNESDVELDNCFEDPECPHQGDVCAAPNVPGMIPPTQRSKKTTAQGSAMVNATETRRIRGHRKK